MSATDWQSGLLEGRENSIILGPDYDEGIERMGVRWVHITDDGPDATSGERWWCEFLDARGNLQAAMAATLLELVRGVRRELDLEPIGGGR